MRTILVVLVVGSSSVAWAANPCGMSVSDWCAAPPGDPCGAHRDVNGCRADPRCYGMPYLGESVVACELDARGFASNCPSVGCTSTAPPPRRLAACELDALEVRAKLDRDTVAVNGRLAADVELVGRAGSKACTVVEWSCGFDANWASTDPAIGVGAIPCQKNAPANREITPAHGITHRLDLAVGDKKTVGVHRFRLAFRPGAGNRKSEARGPAVRSAELSLSILDLGARTIRHADELSQP